MNIGYTTSLSQHMGSLIRLDGGNCGQFFTRSPQTFKIIPFEEDDWCVTKVDLTESDVKMVIHGSFLINFCKSPTSLDYAHKLILEDMKIAFEARSKKMKDEEAAKLAAKESAKQKLSILGLTPEEIASL